MAAYCPRCGRGTWACACDLSFREKLLALQVSYKGYETRDRKNYYDSEALDSQFGADAKERYLEETKGLGSLHRARDGFYKSDGSKATQDEINSLLSGPEEVMTIG